jgi:uncharacterized protein (TIGR03435 family)
MDIIAVTMRDIIGGAFHVLSEKDQIVGGPDWIVNRYDMDTKIGAPLDAASQKISSAQGEQIRLMQQSLLADRLKLKVHFEIREIPVYALIVVQGGPKLTPAKDTQASSGTPLSPVGGDPRTDDLRKGFFASGNTWEVRGLTLDEFVHSGNLVFLREIGSHIVVDKTGLAGAYDFTLHFAMERMAVPCSSSRAGFCHTMGPDADTPSLFTALQEQLGLQLATDESTGRGGCHRPH